MLVHDIDTELAAILIEAAGGFGNDPVGWRRHFVTYAGTRTDEQCQALVDLGMMRRREPDNGQRTYLLTEAGVELVERAKSRSRAA